jgi:hypothetical protein
LVVGLAVSLAALNIHGGIAAASDEAVAPAVDSGTHCVSEAVEVGSTREPASPVCFGTFPEAISYASDGTVQLSPGATPATVSDEDLVPTATSDVQPAAVILGTSYDEHEFLNPQRSWTHTAAYGCDANADIDWQVPNVGASWNDDIDRANAVGSCQGRYNEHASGRGAYVWTPWTLGPMEDYTTSIFWI